MIDEKLLIFGAGSHARRLAASLCDRGNNVLGFVTTQQSPLQELEGLPVYDWDTVPDHLRGKCPVACGIFNRSDAYDQLAGIIQAHGFSRILWPWDYYPQLHHNLGWCYWLDPNPKTLSSWQEDPSYLKVASVLADSESRRILDRVLAFRTGGDLSFASYTSIDHQYFNPLSLSALPSDRSVSFLDIGAYDGDTLQELAQQVAVGQAVLVEPDPSNYTKLVRNLRRLTGLHPGLNAYALPLGAGNKFGILSLAGDGEASTMSMNGDKTQRASRIVTVVALDSMFPSECFDFIKIDVEGHDLQALLGMHDLLRRSHAVLAVSLYHRPQDIVHLPLAVMELIKELPYDYYIRQHMYNSFDTVLYAIPRGGK